MLRLGVSCITLPPSPSVGPFFLVAFVYVLFFFGILSWFLWGVCVFGPESFRGFFKEVVLLVFPFFLPWFLTAALLVVFPFWCFASVCGCSSEDCGFFLFVYVCRSCACADLHPLVFPDVFFTLWTKVLFFGSDPQSHQPGLSSLTLSFAPSLFVLPVPPKPFVWLVYGSSFSSCVVRCFFPRLRPPFGCPEFVLFVCHNPAFFFCCFFQFSDDLVFVLFWSGFPRSVWCFFGLVLCWCVFSPFSCAIDKLIFIWPFPLSPKLRIFFDVQFPFPVPLVLPQVFASSLVENISVYSTGLFRSNILSCLSSICVLVTRVRCFFFF